MNVNRKTIPVLSFVVAIALWWGIFISQKNLTAIRLAHAAPSSMSFVPHTDKIKPYLMGFSSAFADFLWIKTTLYYGGHSLTDQQYPWLLHMVDLVSRLNPHFYPAYEFAGLMIPEVCKNPQAARIILERGISSHVNQQWKLYFYLGMIYYTYYNDKTTAATCFARAVTQKNAPGYRLAGLAAVMFSKAGEEQKGKEFLQFVYTTSENPEVKGYVGEKLMDFERNSTINKIKGSIDP